MRKYFFLVFASVVGLGLLNGLLVLPTLLLLLGPLPPLPANTCSSTAAATMQASAASGSEDGNGLAQQRLQQPPGRVEEDGDML